MMTLIRLL
jgi:hypothetical protein